MKKQASMAETAEPGGVKASEAALGKPTILEFGDLQCGDSANFAAGGRQRILSDYVQSGKCTYAFHDFPLDAHPLAPRAAEIARCAGKRADEMRQRFLAQHASIRSEEELLAQARSMGLDSGAIQQCLGSGASAAAVQKDRALGRQYGVRATPSLVLGMTDSQGSFHLTRVIRADRPIGDVKAQIDEFLSSSAAR